MGRHMLCSKQTDQAASTEIQADETMLPPQGLQPSLQLLLPTGGHL